jgi:hypothetical protein
MTKTAVTVGLPPMVCDTFIAISDFFAKETGHHAPLV